MSKYCDQDYFLDNYNYILKHIEEKFFNAKIKEQIKKEKKEGLEHSINDNSFYAFVLEKNTILLEFLKKLEKENDVGTFLEVINYFFNDYFAIIDKKEVDFQKHPISVKNYRKLCRKKVKAENEKESIGLYLRNKKLSIIEIILNEYLDDKKTIFNIKDIISLCFDFLTIKDSFFIYNLPKREKI